MSNLVLEIKPGEAMLINGAGLRFRTKTRLELTSRARFLFGKQIMAEAEASTPARRIYHALQTAYVGPDADRNDALSRVLALLEASDRRGPEPQRLIDAVREAAVSGECYAALKLARRLIASEDAEAATAGPSAG